MLLGLGLLGACADTSTALPPDDMALFNKMPLIKATPISVGEKLFHDRNLSRLENQSCASCHTGATPFRWTVSDWGGPAGMRRYAVC
jgi:cytochrome c peroxidase